MRGDHFTLSTRWLITLFLVAVDSVWYFFYPSGTWPTSTLRKRIFYHQNLSHRHSWTTRAWSRRSTARAISWLQTHATSASETTETGDIRWMTERSECTAFLSSLKNDVAQTSLSYARNSNANTTPFKNKWTSRTTACSKSTARSYRIGWSTIRIIWESSNVTSRPISTTNWNAFNKSKPSSTKWKRIHSKRYFHCLATLHEMLCFCRLGSLKLVHAWQEREGRWDTSFERRLTTQTTQRRANLEESTSARPQRSTFTAETAQSITVACARTETIRRSS